VYEESRQQIRVQEIRHSQTGRRYRERSKAGLFRVSRGAGNFGKIWFEGW